jgi:type II restriction enzyme
MQLSFNKKLTRGYKNASQRARVLTEQWVHDFVFCPNCGYLQLDKYPNNHPVADFFCPSCKEDYELKSKNGVVGKKILDGAYHTKCKRLKSNTIPNLFILNYDMQSYSVFNFFIIPKHFFTLNIIEERKPLAKTARRPGWVGSNILLHQIPYSGRIFLVQQGEVKSRAGVLTEWNKTLFLRGERKIYAKGWLLDIMRCIDKIGKSKFTLNDIYRFENELSVLYPNNKHIRDKIRQQLQILRNKGYLDFISRGYYRIA